MTPTGMTRAIIFDLDDTLVKTSDLYAEAENRFLDFMEELGFQRAEVVDLFEQRETLNTRKYGVSPKRYPLSMEETYVLIGKKHNRSIDPAHRKQVREFAKWVFRQVPELMEGAIEVLEVLRKKYRLILLTRGARTIQKYKLVKTGLIEYFHSIYIVNSKTEAEYEMVLRREGLDPSETCIVGDSIRSDINPGSKLGLRCIYVPYSLQGYVWSQDKEQPVSDSHISIRTLQELTQLL